MSATVPQVSQVPLMSQAAGGHGVCWGLRGATSPGCLSVLVLPLS